MEMHNHCSCLSLLVLTKIIYTPAYWNCGGAGEGWEWIQFTSSDLHKHSS